MLLRGYFIQYNYDKPTLDFGRAVNIVRTPNTTVVGQYP